MQKRKPSHPLRRLRTLAATLFGCGLTLLFVDYTGTMHHYLSLMAKVQFVPALLAFNILIIAGLLLLTGLFGRVYCSAICPLGVFQDLVARVGRRGKKLPYRYVPPRPWLRYGVLMLFGLSIVLGIGVLTALLDPYGAYGRMAQSLLQPFFEWSGAALASVPARMDSNAACGLEIWLRSWPTLLVAIATLLLVGTLAWRGGRTYCNTICPVGTILGFIARFSWLKVRFNHEKCISCSLCANHCKAACIDIKTHRIDYSRCVACGNCLEHCVHGALAYSGKLQSEHNKEEKSQDVSSVTDNPSGVSRRAFLVAGASIMASAVLARTGLKEDGWLSIVSGAKMPRRKQPVLPPGALSASHFARHCTACQLCVSQCPENVLRPSGRLMTLMQPEMSYERGWCRPGCNRCSQVCPTKAIVPMNHGEKASVQIGCAVWIRENCLTLSRPTGDGVAVRCGRCAEVCPNEAITMVADKQQPDSLVPVVNAARCIGCGACEHFCPARPFSAIYVEGLARHRDV